jgi:hypothetical protein
MVIMNIVDVDRKGRSLYYLLVSCVCPETNRIEFNGKAMNTLDLCAYANMSRTELSKQIGYLYEQNILLNVRAKGKDYYYMNPKFACDPETPPCLLDWLVELFEEESNMEHKELVYFTKNPRDIKIDIRSILPK